MIKDTLQKNEAVTSNSPTLEVLHTHFPQCFNKEGNFDLDKFKELVRTDVDITHEGYDLNFLGKNYAKLLASVDTSTVIQPDKEHNSKPENANSQNLYISGDNLDGLKHLLKSYAGAVKCIYIDPPYNTGSDGFVYNDKFNYSAEELTNKLSISDEQAKKILDLTRRGSASHSAWLTFMYPRLLLARDLLKKDGVLFISIDDNEQANLRLLCDSVFGEENFFADMIVIRAEGGGLAKRVIKGHDNLFAFVKNNDEFNGIYKPKDVRGKIIEKDGRKFWIEEDWLRIEFGKYGTLCYEDIENVKGIEKKNEIDKGIQKDEYRLIKKGEKHIVGRLRALDVDGTKFYSVLKHLNKNGVTDLESLKLEKYFSYPKPVSLVKELILGATIFSSQSNEIIIDFFSGSATTSEAVMQLNAFDEGNRKYICVQLPEKLDPENSIQKTTFDFLKSINLPTTLDYIGMERIRRAAAKIKAETGADIDYGFKHYTLVEPSPNTLDKLEEFNASEMFTNNDTLSLFGKETVLETWLVKDGYGFGAKIQEVKLANYSAYLCGKHLYFIEAGIDENDMVALLDKYQQESAFSPENIVVFGYSFNFSQTEMLRKNLFVLKDSHKNLKANFDIRY